jgi:hypothetical protein
MGIHQPSLRGAPGVGILIRIPKRSDREEDLLRYLATMAETLIKDIFDEPTPYWDIICVVDDWQIQIRADTRKVGKALLVVSPRDARLLSVMINANCPPNLLTEIAQKIEDAWLQQICEFAEVESLPLQIAIFGSHNKHG